MRCVARMQQVVAFFFFFFPGCTQIFGAGGRGRGAMKVQLFNKLTIIRNDEDGGTGRIKIHSFIHSFKDGRTRRSASGFTLRRAA